MNMKEWKLCNEPSKYEWYNKTRIIQKSLQYNNDPSAKVIHHLRDTEEQRKYNDEHYELWGFEIDEDGNEHFEYGKYVVFWTKEHHDSYHYCSEETRKKKSDCMTKVWSSSEFRAKMKAIHSSDNHRTKLSISHKNIVPYNKGAKLTEEHRKKLSESHKGKSPANKGVKMSDDQKNKLRDSLLKYFESSDARTKRSNAQKALWLNDEYRNKMSDAHKGKAFSDETRLKMSAAHKNRSYQRLSDEHRQKLKDNHADFSGEKHPFYGKHHSDEAIQRMKDTQKKLGADKSSRYKEYKESGGTLKWADFLKYVYGKNHE